jgi:hypothetical protein
MNELLEVLEQLLSKGRVSNYAKVECPENALLT